MRSSSVATLSSSDLWDAFQAKAEAVGTRVERAASEDDARGLLLAVPGMASTGTARAVLPDVVAGLPACADPRSGAPAVVAAGHFGVAETGSVVVAESATDRGACYLSEHLWLLVPGEAMAATLDEALVRIGAMIAAGGHYATLMTGPSRTADIERTLTVGVHGPRTLTVVVVGG